MHPFSILTLAIFVAGYITARWDLVTRLYELAIFAIDHGVLVSSPEELYKVLAKFVFPKTRTLKGFAIISLFFFLFILPLERVAARESVLVGHVPRALKLHAQIC